MFFRKVKVNVPSLGDPLFELAFAGSATYGNLVGRFIRFDQKEVSLWDSTGRGPESPYIEWLLDLRELDGRGFSVEMIEAEDALGFMEKVLSDEDRIQLRKELKEKTKNLRASGRTRAMYNALLKKEDEKEWYELIPLLRWHEEMLEVISGNADGLHGWAHAQQKKEEVAA